MDEAKAKLDELDRAHNSAEMRERERVGLRSDMRTIAKGLLHTGLDASKLSPQGKADLRAAIDTTLRLAK